MTGDVQSGESRIIQAIEALGDKFALRMREVEKAVTGLTVRMNEMDKHERLTRSDVRVEINEALKDYPTNKDLEEAIGPMRRIVYGAVATILGVVLIAIVALVVVCSGPLC